MNRIPLVIGLIVTLYGLSCVGSVVGYEVYGIEMWNVSFLRDPGLWLIYRLIEVIDGIPFLSVLGHGQLALFVSAVFVVIAIGAGFWAIGHIIASQIHARRHHKVQKTRALQEDVEER